MRQVSVHWEQSVCVVSDQCWVVKGHAHLNWMQGRNCIIHGLLGSLSIHRMNRSRLQHHERGLDLCFSFFLYTPLHPSKLGIGLLLKLKASRGSGEQSCGQSQLPAGDPEEWLVLPGCFLPWLPRRTTKHILTPPTPLWSALISGF